MPHRNTDVCGMHFKKTTDPNATKTLNRIVAGEPMIFIINLKITTWFSRLRIWTWVLNSLMFKHLAAVRAQAGD